MSGAFEFFDQELPAIERHKIFVTGAAGRMGQCFAQTFGNRYDLTLMACEGEDAQPIEGCGVVVRAALAQSDRLGELMAGHDTVIHLAGNPNPKASWENLLENNIVGTQHVLDAALRASCRRVILASSIHAVGGHPGRRQIHADDPVSPGNLYGVSKCCMEALARYFATQKGLSTLAIRIGLFADDQRVIESPQMGYFDGWIHRDDMMQLLRLCVEDRRLRFAILHGLSNNRFNRMDITETCHLTGYRPQHDFTAENIHAAALGLSAGVYEHNEGDYLRRGRR